MVKQPVAGVERGVRAENTSLSAAGQRPPGRIIALDRGKRDLLRHECEPMTATATTAILEIEDVSAGLADEELQKTGSRIEIR